MRPKALSREPLSVIPSIGNQAIAEETVDSRGTHHHPLQEVFFLFFFHPPLFSSLVEGSSAQPHWTIDQEGLRQRYLEKSKVKSKRHVVKKDVFCRGVVRVNHKIHETQNLILVVIYFSLDHRPPKIELVLASHSNISDSNFSRNQFWQISLRRSG